MNSRYQTSETLVALYKMFTAQKRKHEAQDVLKDARALGYEEAASTMEQHDR